MTYRIVHKTNYKYKYPVSFGNHVVYLTPRSQPHHARTGQRCESHVLLITPPPATLTERTDYFGNRVSFFTIQEPHEELAIEARSLVTIDGDGVWPERSPAWDEVARELPEDTSPAGLEAFQFVFESPRIKPSDEFAAYAAASFPPGRPLAEALLDFTGRIFKEFRFDSKATNVRTPPEEVLKERKAVDDVFASVEDLSHDVRNASAVSLACKKGASRKIKPAPFWIASAIAFRECEQHAPAPGCHQPYSVIPCYRAFKSHAGENERLMSRVQRFGAMRTVLRLWYKPASQRT